MFFYAQKAVLHPMAPLYLTESKDVSVILVYDVKYIGDDIYDVAPIKSIVDREMSPRSN